MSDRLSVRLLRGGEQVLRELSSGGWVEHYPAACCPAEVFYPGRCWLLTAAGTRSPLALTSFRRLRDQGRLRLAEHRGAAEVWTLPEAVPPPDWSLIWRGFRRP